MRCGRAFYYVCTGLDVFSITLAFTRIRCPLMARGVACLALLWYKVAVFHIPLWCNLSSEPHSGRPKGWLMNNHSEIVGFIWSIADLIRDAFKRSKYQDVILPLTVL